MNLRPCTVRTAKAVAAAVLLSFVAVPEVFAADPSPKSKATQGASNRDVRSERKSFGAARSARAREAMAAAQGRLAREVPGLEVTFNELTGAAEIVRGFKGRGLLASGSAHDKEGTLRGFLAKNAGIYGLTPREAAQLRKTADYQNPAGNLAWVELKQELHGKPVFQGELRAAFTANGELVQTTGLLAAGTESAPAAAPALSAAQAVSQAAASIAVALDPESLVVKESAEDGSWVLFEPGPFAEDIRVEQTYFPLDTAELALAWSTVLWQDTPAYYTIVDAQSGDVLWRKNITEEQTAPATYSVYNDDNPAPLSPSNATPGSGIQGAAIPRTSLTLIHENAADNLGWITDGGNTTTGNNVDAGLDIVGPNGIDPAGRAVGAPFRVFDFAYNPGPAGGDEPALANYRMGAVTNLFFWSNRYHDRLYDLGFTESARNFQQDNFGRGGLGNDRVRAEAQDASGTNNANFSTPGDGQLPRMQMFIWPNPTPDRDGDLDQEIILHELTHGTSNRLHGNATGLSAVISRGMGEGWSDFYARVLLSDASEDVDGLFAFGAYSTYLAAAGYTDNYYSGIRRFPYAVKTNVGPNGKPHNPLTFADLDPNQIDLTDGAFPRGPFGVGGRAGATAVHTMGEIWAMSLLEVRARLIHRLGYAVGNQRSLQLVTDGMKLDPAAPNHLTGRNSLLAADAAFGNEDELDIWAGFATRGMGFGASIVSATNQNAKESFDYPIPGMGPVVVADHPCAADGFADVGESLLLTIPLTNPLAQPITGISASVTGGGSAAYPDLAPGATATQTISYQVPATAACGSRLAVSVVVASSLGTETKSFDIRLGHTVATYSENFDGVTAPALPAGWTTAASGPIGNWSTTLVAADTPPNSVASAFTTTTSNNSLTSPVIALPTGPSQLSFRHSYISEFNWDGGVLEISVNGGAFVDILDAGGRFETGGYTFALMRTADGNTSVLQARAAWTGNSGGFITTIVDLPASAAGQNVQLRFRAAADSADTVANAHWRIDSLTISAFACASVGTTTAVAPAAGQYSDPVSLVAHVASTCPAPEGSLQFLLNGVPVGGPVPLSGGIASTSTVIDLAAGLYPVSGLFTSSNPFYLDSSGAGTLTVSREDAIVTPVDPAPVKVAIPGGTVASVTISASIQELPDGSLGDISLAIPVSVALVPVGPGSTLNALASVSGGGVGGTLAASATFTNVPVNVYDVVITIGGAYYTGSGGTVLAIYDPSLGFVTGGGTVVHDGVKGNFGLNVKFLKSGQAQGSLLFIDHRLSGDVKVKSNAMGTVSIVGKTAIVLGKTTVNGVGNHSFRVTVVDNGEPGSLDTFALRVTSPGNVVVPGLDFGPVTLSGGNVQVPQAPKK
jgi:hypothetical protein